MKKLKNLVSALPCCEVKANDHFDPGRLIFSLAPGKIDVKVVGPLLSRATDPEFRRPLLRIAVLPAFTLLGVKTHCFQKFRLMTEVRPSACGFDLLAESLDRR
jgi:hypothetical protein